MRHRRWMQWMRWGLWRVPAVTLALSLLLKAGMNLMEILSETSGKSMAIHTLPLLTLILYAVAGKTYFTVYRRREIAWSAALIVLAQGLFYVMDGICVNVGCELGSFLTGQILQWLFQGGEGLRLWMQHGVGAPAWLAVLIALALPFLLVPFGYMPKRRTEAE